MLQDKTLKYTIKIKMKMKNANNIYLIGYFELSIRI
jgi:hypothetical protein